MRYGGRRRVMRVRRRKGAWPPRKHTRRDVRERRRSTTGTGPTPQRAVIVATVLMLAAVAGVTKVAPAVGIELVASSDPIGVPVDAAIVLLIGSVLAAAIGSRLVAQTDVSKGPAGDGRSDDGAGHAATAPRVGLGLVEVDPAEGRAAGGVGLAVAVHNQDHQIANATRVTFLVGRDRAEMEPVDSIVIDVPAHAIVSGRGIWIPPSDGEWLVQAHLDGTDGGGPITPVSIPARDRIDGDLAGPDDQHRRLIPAVFVVLGTLLVLAVRSRLLRRRAPHRDRGDVGHDG